jgi:hypothetical protein
MVEQTEQSWREDQEIETLSSARRILARRRLWGIGIFVLLALLAMWLDGSFS